jgi:prepilin-type N-terminal cleavage/methylation domain-containing protein
MERTEPFASEHGFSMVEVLVGVTILLIGVLGVATIVNVANQTTSVSIAREGATNLSRELLERAREVPYGDLTPAGAAAAMQDLSGLGNAGDGSTWTIRRRVPVDGDSTQGYTYTVTVDACDIDDPSDGVAPRDPATFCVLTGDPDPGGGGGAGGTVQTGVYADLGIFGSEIHSQLSGSLTNQLCTLLGAATVTLPSVTQLIRGGADVRLCPSSGQPAALDTNPRDFKRVKVTLTWNDGKSTLVQNSLIPNPVSVGQIGGVS